MSRTNPNKKDASLQSILFWFAAAYLCLAFPFAYFRHDDWIILGNGVRRIPLDWHFIFQPNLFMGSEETVWFFRPLFKLIQLVLLNFLGYNYYLWLTVTLIFTTGALWLGAKVVEWLTGSATQAVVFVLLFATSLHLHFGSLVWAGEAAMNCPQIFLLFLNLYCLTQAYDSIDHRRSRLWQGSAFLSFILALGFKEAAVFHVVFLFAFFFCGSKVAEKSVRSRILLLAPYAVLAPLYLLYRLKGMPFNPGYVPQFERNAILTPAFYITGALVFPLSILMGALALESLDRVRQMFHNFPKVWLYLPFLLLSVVSYVGHPFFSPGWLLAPGIYFSFVIALVFPELQKNSKALPRFGYTTLLLSTLFVGYHLKQVGWWQWHKPQRQVQALIQNIGDQKFERLVIYDCANPKFPDSTLRRVVASEAGLYEMWALFHGSSPKIEVASCPDSEDENKINTPNTLRLKWRFPEFTLLTH